MIWNLLLAHFLGDFPLQPMWLVRSKERIWGLVLHATIHFLVALLLVGPARTQVWPTVLALSVFHFTVDVIKYRLGIKRHLWSAVSYFVDQTVHVLSLVVVAGWIGSIAPGASGLFTPAIAIYACGYLIATHVWYVTEKTISGDHTPYRGELENTLWSRMLVRAGLLSALLLLVPLAAGDRSRAGRKGMLLAVGAVQLPYQKNHQWRRALTTDVVVTVLAAVFIRLASGGI